jgi:hypothetical protein
MKVMDMKERPIIFTAPMVNAILRGEKTQTRRIVKHQFDAITDYRPGHDSELLALCPYGKIGDVLWVRETWKSLGIHERLKPSEIPVGSDIQYPATYDGWVSKRRPSIFMPRWASRITLRIVNVRAERLQDISEADAYAEGIDTEGCAYLTAEHHKLGGCSGPSASVCAFQGLWQSIHGPESWEENCWVWVIEFERIEPCTWKD